MQHRDLPPHQALGANEDFTVGCGWLGLQAVGRGAEQSVLIAGWQSGTSQAEQCSQARKCKAALHCVVCVRVGVGGGQNHEQQQTIMEVPSRRLRWRRSGQ